MRVIIDLLRRFRSDERGVFAVIFGLMAIVLVTFAGAVVDYTSVETARTRAQQALDSAALGMQPLMFATTPPTTQQYKDRAKALVDESLADASILTKIDKATTSTVDGTLHLEGELTVKTAFVQLIGISTMTTRIVSEATRKRLNLEVAMVLDNSLSMDEYLDVNKNGKQDTTEKTRMENLILAARCATDVLFSGTTDCTAGTKLDSEDNKAAVTSNVKIGIVPFTEFVNVGTKYKTASWMDQSGMSSLSKDNFDNDDDDSNTFAGPLNRWTLYSQITGVSWAGCVEARRQPYDTTDETPTGGDTLFVPEFAPDEPDTGSYSNSYLNDRPTVCTNKDQGSWEKVITKTVCDKNGNNSSSNFTSAACSTSNTTTTQKDKDGKSVTALAVEPEFINGQAKACTDTYTGSRTSTNPSRYTNVYTRSCSYTFSDRELQERQCKYKGAVDTSKPGPNQDCPYNPLTALTNQKKPVLDAIKAMKPQGYTNIHQGAIWGYHMLSPTEPLPEAKDYDTSTVKVMILMTDGDNTVNGYNAGNMNKAKGFQAYGYPNALNGRIYSSTYPNPTTGAQVVTAMNDRTLETCKQAKKPVATKEPDKIVIYTIGLSSPNATTKDLLTKCATDSSHAFFPDDPASLTATFKLIADQLANLRLSQ